MDVEDTEAVDIYAKLKAGQITGRAVLIPGVARHVRAAEDKFDKASLAPMYS